MPQLIRNGILHKDFGWLLLITVAGLTLRFLTINFYDHVPESDELAYQSMALNLVAGHGIVDFMGNHAMFNVGYPLFILAPVFALFGNDVYAARVINVLLGGVSILLCYGVAKEGGAGRIGRLLASGMWAFYLPASVYAVYLLKENLLIPTMLGVIWCMLRLLKKPSYSTALYCGFLFGLLALTGNSALALALPAIMAIWLAPSDFSRKLRTLAIIFLSASLVAVPWIIRNTHVLGAPVLNTNGGFNLYLGNNPAATGMFMSIRDTPRGPTWESMRKEGEVESSETLKRDAIEWIREHPFEFFGLAFKKAMLFWTPPVHEGKGQASKAEFVARIIWNIEFIVLVAGAIGSLFLINRQIGILWTTIVVYTAVHMLFFVLFRYREPIMPCLCVLTAVSFEYLILRWGRHVHPTLDAN